MKKLWKNRPILIALLAAALFLVLAALTVGRRTASRGEDMFASAVLPVQEAVSDMTDRVTDFFTRVFFPSSLQQENEYLKKLEFSEGYEILYAIAFGYPDETPDAKPRDWGKVKFLD